MSVETFGINIKQDTSLMIKELEQVTPSWMEQAVSLGLLVNKGEIYQRLGKDYLKISMRDIDPLPAPFPGDPGAKRLTFTIGDDIFTDVRRAGFAYFDDWLSRAAALRLRAEQMNLLRLVNGEFKGIDFSV